MSRYNPEEDYEDWQSETPDFNQYRRSKQNLLPAPKGLGSNSHNNRQKGDYNGSRNPFTDSLRERSRGLGNSGIRTNSRPDSHEKNNNNRSNNRPENRKKKDKNRDRDQSNNNPNNKNVQDTYKQRHVSNDNYLGPPSKPVNSKSDNIPQKVFERTYNIYDLRLWNSRQLSSLEYMEKKGNLSIENVQKLFFGYKVRIKFRQINSIDAIVKKLSGPIRPISKRVG